MTYPEFRKLNFKILYAKKWVVIISAFAVLFILASIIMNMVHYYTILDSDYYSFGVILVTMAITLPVTILLIAKRSFKSNLMVQELIAYEFSDEGVKVKGESFSSDYKWSKLHKVAITNDWLLLYPSKMLAIFVKTNEVSAENLEQLKHLFKAQGIKIQQIK
ncbi:hypothetical protein BEL04_23480 [Mucilaginibacter sp. PPCGB 2223]|nr:hypothetical protein BEL04_23480 [Mucilaginibacter sp. PPCGB 2223]